MNIKIVLFFLMSFQFCFCQKTYDTNSELETNIYFHSIKEYLDSVTKGSPEKDYEYYIEKKHIHLDSFPKLINGRKVNWLKKIDLEELLNKNQLNIINLAINPIMIEKDKFYISIIPYYVNTKFKKYQVLKGIFKFQFEFDIQLNGLIFKNMIIE
ncbi:hypothetical protein H8K90_11435 [Winogradskyella echinorum]|uniref:Uncharacterized protein n=1 Tax=Winogradskyella echinorum TaxID=538189 RepID=A0ABR6Y422_9FLAO|nr:hypothetical protein [Winogradskyella echinorum]MBC3846995.1 hypothetical protein [Winogradskyella echinorum]MBC5751343.1 hypothetical protein [Winogradskyella echinorum]